MQRQIKKKKREKYFYMLTIYLEGIEQKLCKKAQKIDEATLLSVLNRHNIQYTQDGLCSVDFIQYTCVCATMPAMPISFCSIALQ